VEYTIVPRARPVTVVAAVFADEVRNRELNSGTRNSSR
jgi:hypothetical protein